MCYYDDGFYNEPSEFEQQIYEFKDALAKQIKEEFINKMNKLEEENRTLQSVKDNLENIKQEYKSKEYKLEAERVRLKSEVRKERLGDLFGDCKVEMYSVGYKSVEQPKCDKCDKDRKIWFKTPSGKKTYEMCSCAEHTHLFEPIPAILYELQPDGSPRDTHIWYKIKPGTYRQEYLSYETDSINKDKLITNEDEFEGKHYWNVLFRDKELAQKFCDYTNKNQEKE